MRWEVQLLPAADASPGDPDAVQPVLLPEPSTTEDQADSRAEPAFAVRHPRSLGLLWWVSLLVVGLDQITKALVKHVLPLYSSRTIIPGLMDFVHVQNAGVAFGLLNDVVHPQRNLLTTALALVALAGIGYYARQVGPSERMARVGLSLILGGAIGNLLDRMRQGFVVDFVDMYWRDWHFWAFNVADAAITIGAVLIFLELLTPKAHASHSV
ncbi:MAG: signal peptidase II [Vicinamibacterales bacterium]